jgi:hypothetical protein
MQLLVSWTTTLTNAIRLEKRNQGSLRSIVKSGFVFSVVDHGTNAMSPVTPDAQNVAVALGR